MLKNHVQLIGRLGKDVLLKTTENGKKIATFSVATNYYYKDAKGESKEITDWHRVKSFGKQAELMSTLLTKGTEVMISGRLSSGSYDKEGQTHYYTEVVADEFYKVSREKAVASL